MKTHRACFLLFLLPVLAAACGGTSDAAGDDPDTSASEIGTKPAPTSITWQELSLPRAGLDGDLTIDDLVFVKRPDGTPVTRDGGKPIMFVLARYGMKYLAQAQGPLGPRIDPGVVLLLRSTDGGDTFQIHTQLPGLGHRAHIAINGQPRGEDDVRIYVSAPSDDVGGRGGPLAYHSTLIRSDDFGYSFTSLPGGVDDVEVEPTNSWHLTGIDCRGLVDSKDGGKTWTVLTERGVPHYCESAHVVRTKDPRRVYAIFGVGELGMPSLHRSDDAGKTFAPVPEDSYARANMIADPLDANHVWAWDNREFASSADGARTFAKHTRGFTPDGNPEISFSLSNLAVDDLHRPPNQEKHALWFANGARVVRWTPSNGAQDGEWKSIATLPARGVRLDIAGRGSAPKAYAIVERDGGKQALLRGTFAYGP